MHRAKRERNTYYSVRERTRAPRPSRARIIGIDGEGVGRDPHLYTYLAAVEESGATWEVANGKGLSTVECLDLVLSLPARTLVIGFALIYDLTKWLEDLPDRLLYLLFHEERRMALIDGKVVFKPVRWRGYKINFMNRRFTVAKGTRRTTVWDVFRFYQSKFTKALRDWKVGTDAELDAMELMKAKRAVFDKLSTEEIHAYCKKECAFLTQLGRKLLSAHESAGLPLRHFYGAGSTASAFLDKIDVRGKRGDHPAGMRIPLACGFFGGRFENSWFGALNGPVIDYDISSAYPYHATLLPCLLHGRWSRGRRLKDATSARLALIKWTIREHFDTTRAWGPLPVRSRDGTITFPLSAKGGWTWQREFQAAQKLEPRTEFVESWNYNTDCDCRPFKDIPTYYRERLKLGKDGPGIVLKLGMNSIYGKLAQSRGLNPQFQSWVWAGNITSGCRAQLLEALTLTKDPWDVLMFATDGVWTRTPLAMPKPEDTGTWDAIDISNGKAKPLGGWEEKTFKRGVFCVRPGIYFPLEPTEEEIEKVRARGLGRKLLYEQWRKVVKAWRDGKTGVTLRGVSRFIGAKTGFSYGARKGLSRRGELGEWVEYPVNVSFTPLPKRVAMDGQRLVAHRYIDVESVPYDRALVSPEARLLALAETIAEEQPDADFTEG